MAKEFYTEDRQFADRVLRAWLHTLRDRLTVEASAHFSAQLPDLIRGIFYQAWNPSAVPDKYDAEGVNPRSAWAVAAPTPKRATATPPDSSAPPSNVFTVR